MLVSVDGVLASIEHSKLFKSIILRFVVLVSVHGVLASVEHSKQSKSMILCFVVLWPDASLLRRSTSFNRTL